MQALAGGFPVRLDAPVMPSFDRCVDRFSGRAAGSGFARGISGQNVFDKLERAHGVGSGVMGLKNQLCFVGCLPEEEPHAGLLANVEVGGLSWKCREGRIFGRDEQWRMEIGLVRPDQSAGLLGDNAAGQRVIVLCV